MAPDPLAPGAHVGAEVGLVAVTPSVAPALLRLVARKLEGLRVAALGPSAEDLQVGRQRRHETQHVYHGAQMTVGERRVLEKQCHVGELRPQPPRVREVRVVAAADVRKVRNFDRREARDAFDRRRVGAAAVPLAVHEGADRGDASRRRGRDGPQHGRRGFVVRGDDDVEARVGPVACAETNRRAAAPVY